MKNLSALLERLTGTLRADEMLRAAVKDAVKECTGGILKDSDIAVKDGTLTLNASAAFKNELRLKEEKVLQCIYEKSGKRLQRLAYS